MGPDGSIMFSRIFHIFLWMFCSEKTSGKISPNAQKRQKKTTQQKKLVYTPPKFNIAPEQWWLEGYFPFGKAYFLRAMLNFRGVPYLPSSPLLFI